MPFIPNNVITQVKNQNNSLSKQDIEILLDMIKKSNFLGENIEVIYNLIIKLQNQYLEIK